MTFIHHILTQIRSRQAGRSAFSIVSFYKENWSEDFSCGLNDQHWVNMSLPQLQGWLEKQALFGIFSLFQRWVLPVWKKGFVNGEKEIIVFIPILSGWSTVLCFLNSLKFHYSYIYIFCMFVHLLWAFQALSVGCSSLHPCLAHSRQSNLLNK